MGGMGEQSCLVRACYRSYTLAAVNGAAALFSKSYSNMSWGKKKTKQLRSLNREVKVRNDHRQEADENLLPGDLSKEEDRKYKHVVLLLVSKLQMI